MTVTDIFYTHRPVPCSVIIRDISSCSRWEIIQRHIVDIIERVRDLGKHSPKWDISIQSLFSGIKESHGRDRECKNQRAWKSPRKQAH